MSIIYDIGNLTSIAGTAGTVIDGDITVQISGGTIISGYVKNSLAATVSSAAVAIYQSVNSAAATLIGDCISNADGLYLFGIKTVTVNTVYSADAGVYRA